MDPEILALVSGMPLSELDIRPATVIDHVQREVIGEVFPVLVPAPGQHADGFLIYGLSAQALDRILFFEGEEYRLEPLTVRLSDGLHAARYFRDTAVYQISEHSWDFDGWRIKERDEFIRRTNDYMALYNTMSAADADAHW